MKRTFQLSALVLMSALALSSCGTGSSVPAQVEGVKTSSSVPAGYRLSGDVLVPLQSLKSQGFHTSNLWNSTQTGQNTRYEVPYVISSAVNSTNRNAIVQNISNWNALPLRIKWVVRSGQTDYVSFEQNTNPNVGGYSYVGRVGGVQALSLTFPIDEYTQYHEMGHAIGLLHEQQRCDRDSFISVNYSNIKPYAQPTSSGGDGRFEKKCGNSSYFNQGPYNYYSFMHYRSFFDDAVNVCLPTMFSLNHAVTGFNTSGCSTQYDDFGQRRTSGISTINQGDRDTINALYPQRPGGGTLPYCNQVPPGYIGNCNPNPAG
jgi:hypothetical protein